MLYTELLLRSENDGAGVERNTDQGNWCFTIFGDHTPRHSKRSRCLLAQPGSLDSSLSSFCSLGLYAACRHGREQDETRQEESGLCRKSGISRRKSGWAQASVRSGSILPIEASQTRRDRRGRRHASFGTWTSIFTS